MRAPDAAGVCWRETPNGNGESVYSPMARNVSSLENCAVLLEALRLQGQRNTNGAYQGYFIFVDADTIASSKNPNHAGYPILQPPQRDAVDAELKRMLKARGGALPSAGDISLERK